LDLYLAFGFCGLEFPVSVTPAIGFAEVEWSELPDLVIRQKSDELEIAQIFASESLHSAELLSIAPPPAY
jgi:hypothetical protein